ncbi:hypothetical protein PQR54_24340 [Paraburkholderia phytofirmans]
MFIDFVLYEHVDQVPVEFGNFHRGRLDSHLYKNLSGRTFDRIATDNRGNGQRWHALAPQSVSQ